MGRASRYGATPRSAKALLMLAVACILSATAVAGTQAQLPDHLVVTWDFDDDLDGWAQSTWEEMGAQVYAEGGEMRGRVQRAGQVPRFDSPLFRANASDKLTVVMRVKYGGQRERGARVDVRLLGSESTVEDFQSLPRPFGGGAATIASVPFDEEVFPDGRYAIIKAPIHEYVNGTVVQLRIFPIQFDPENTIVEPWGTFDIDWIRLVEAPTITKVEGCLNKYFDEAPEPLHPSLMSQRSEDGEYVFRGGSEDGVNNVTIKAIASNGDGHLLHKSSFLQESPESPYATTFNCPRQGPQTRIRITGRNLGDYATIAAPIEATLDAQVAEEANAPGGTLQKWDTVTINGQICADVVMLEVERMIECTLPSTAATNGLDRVPVTVQQPDYRCLEDSKPYLSYMVPAPQPLAAPEVANLGSRGLDLTWSAPSDPWDAATVTGYVVLVYEEPLDPFFKDNAPGRLPVNRTNRFTLIREDVLGNVTSTSIVGLGPERNYRFALQALVEDPREASCWKVDLYGRRQLLTGALRSVSSALTAVETTLSLDVHFPSFPASSTLEVGATDARTLLGPSRNEGGEGHYGLRLVGSAQIANCNETSLCCDHASDGSCETICVSTATQVGVDPDYLNLDADREVPGNSAENGQELYVGPLAGIPGGDLPDGPFPACGPALRLTPSRARASGAAWYPRKMNVREGFVTEFTLRLSNPSLVCTVMDDEATQCRSRGADGLAFVIQNEASSALGHGGMNLGFGGISNALAIEFDTFHNPEKRDPYENHIAVFATSTKGDVMDSGHHMSLASTTAVPDLTQGSHRIRIEYSPRMREDDILDPAFFATAQTATLMASQNAWGWEMGSLKIFVNDLHRPCFQAIPSLVPHRLEDLNGLLMTYVCLCSTVVSVEAIALVAIAFRLEVVSQFKIV
ncbi:Hypothetical Protein FCC1311_108482 [Hondaea fermentalgiana]|uniref:Uncharacterized protein n=1 Tax=Hondaea fermentalgiana TaxID=2315210 RepID=A0A2R5GUV2_9STRA|nr:Hypothetical Protein FCC1311_108482 [Hondaea fermentalgiana]|eukprot:GBG34626.1 Hypothetical Protein FCC1311_108482 [Hondaea fermentalgiana]